MLVNAGTGGLVRPLNSYVNDTVASNGGGYGVANASANVGVSILGMVSGYSQIKTGLSLLGTGGRISGGIMLGSGAGLGIAGAGITTGTIEGGMSIAAGAGLYLGGSYVCATGFGVGGGGGQQPPKGQNPGPCRPGVGTQAVVPPGTTNYRPLAWKWPAIMKDGKVYVHRTAPLGQLDG